MERITPACWELARGVLAEARRHGLVAPGFRSPPRVAGAHRTLRRYGDGSGLVSVRCHGRPAADVLADMVEGVLVLNGITGPEADRWRALMIHALCPAAEPPCPGAQGPAGARAA